MTAARHTLPRTRPAKAPAIVRVVQRPPAQGVAGELAGQGQRLFQLFRPELLHAFAAKGSDRG